MSWRNEKVKWLDSETVKFSFEVPQLNSFHHVSGLLSDIGGGSGTLDSFFLRDKDGDKSLDFKALDFEISGTLADIDRLIRKWIDKAFDGNDRFIGNKYRDVLDGDSGNDTLIGNGGNDKLLGQDGNDNILGGNGKDKAKGGAGEDTVLGNRGNDRLFGGSEDDKLKGGPGNDTLKGGSGDDILIGGPGDDTLNGGGGVDCFVFASGHGDDVVQDFEDGIDQLKITKGASDFSDLKVSASGSDTLVKFADVSITLIGVSPGDIDASDFVF